MPINNSYAKQTSGVSAQSSATASTADSLHEQYPNLQPAQAQFIIAQGYDKYTKAGGTETKDQWVSNDLAHDLGQLTGESDRQAAHDLQSLNDPDNNPFADLPNGRQSIAAVNAESGRPPPIFKQIGD